VGGMTKTRFLAAESFSNLTFLTTTFYAVILLGESITASQGIAVGLALLGALLFFEWGSTSKASAAKDAKGLWMIIFSLFIAPLEWVIYKESTFHAATYAQFLTGRVVMDFAYYSVLFFLMFVILYKKSPWPQIKAFTASSAAIAFTTGSIIYNLIDSYLFFKLPVTLLTIIGTSSIVAGYVIGSVKYKERFRWRYALGGVLIAGAVILFVASNGNLS
jgi:drug/metabolite transporter (DMT)-like permease